MDFGKAYTPDTDVLPRPMVTSTGGVTSKFEEIKQGGKKKSMKKMNKSKKNKSKKSTKSKKNKSKKNK